MPTPTSSGSGSSGRSASTAWRPSSRRPRPTRGHRVRHSPTDDPTMRFHTLTTAALVLLSATSLRAQKTGVPDLAPYLIADRAEEIALARSSAPRNVSDSATILVLEKSGYVQAVR